MKLHLASLQSRIVVLHLLAIVAAAIAVPVANYFVINRSTNEFEERTLRSHANTIAGYLKRGREAGWVLSLPADLQALYAHGLDGLSYEIVDNNRQVLFSSGSNIDAAIIPMSQGRLSRILYNDAVIYGLTEPRGNGTTEPTIKIAQNVQHPDVIFDDIVLDYQVHIGWFVVAILALLLIIDIVIIRTALRPVLRASNIASAIAPSRMTLRLPVAGMPRELLPLIIAMNEALDRLERGIQAQREFTADAAHELRTPLAVIRARIDTLPDNGKLTALKSDLDIMGSVVGQLLEISELEGAALAPDAAFDLQAIALDVVGMLAGLAIAQGKEIALTGCETPVFVQGNAAMVFRLIRNLADNALRYTPPNTTVEVEISKTGTVSVEDEGPGISEENRKHIFQRFWRAEHNNNDGAGLGLAIVSRIAELHGADIEIFNKPSGGAVFAVKFRLAHLGEE